MNSFKLMPHTADIRLQIKASSLQALFITALKGVNSLLKKSKLTINPMLCHKLDSSALDTTALLIDFLGDVLTLSHIHRAVFYDVAFEQLTSTQLTAVITGTLVKTFSADVKAVSYHEADIIEHATGHYETTITLDI